MQHGGFIYILTNVNNTTLYVGVTSNLVARIIEHKENRFKTSFSAKYNLHKLVYFETFPSIEEAITREKQLKAGNRARKIELINANNANWADLFDEIKEW